MDQLSEWCEEEMIKVVTGVRRCGKSVLLNLLREEIGDPEHSIYFNFESKKNEKYTNADMLYDYVIKKVGDSREKWYLFFDEIQEVTDWEETINSFRVDFDADIYITG